MRTRDKITVGTKPTNLPGRGGSSSGGTTCAREVPLDEVIDNFWGGNFPTESSVDSTQYEEFTDVVTPGFFEKRRSGAILPTNPMSSKIIDTVDTAAESLLGYTLYAYKPCNSPKGRDSIRFRHGTVKVSAGPIGAPTKILTESEINQARIEALASLKTQGMDVLTSAAELHKTLAMLAGARRRLIGMIENLLKSLRSLGIKPKSWSAFIQALSDPWLEGRFGWRILWYDLLNIMDYIDNLDKRSRVIVGRSSASATRDFSTSTYGDTTVTHKVSLGYPGILDPKIPGYGSIVNTAWDIIPFSLVVDMFFDVQGRIIALLSTPQNVTELKQSAFMVEELVRTQSIQAKMDPVDGYSLVLHNNPVLIEQRYEVKTRTNVAQPGLDLPPLKISLGGYKPIDLAFLARLIVKKVFS